MSASLRFRTYTFDGGQELLSGFAADGERRLLVIPPLFDEMNRMRRTVMLAMRDLAARDIASDLIDLPGCGESETRLEAQSLGSWRAAVSAAAEQADQPYTHILSLRGGALVDDGPGLPILRLAPAKGSALLKAMLRTRIASDKEAGIDTDRKELMAKAKSEALLLAGNYLGPAMIGELETAQPAQVSDVETMKVGASDASGSVKGSALWLRAEPDEDAEFAANIAEAVDQWSGPK